MKRGNIRQINATPSNPKARANRKGTFIYVSNYVQINVGNFVGNQSISGKQKHIQNRTGVNFLYLDGKGVGADKIHGFGSRRDIMPEMSKTHTARKGCGVSPLGCGER